KKVGAKKAAAAAKPVKQTKQTSSAKATGRRGTERLGAGARATQRKTKTRVLKKEQPAIEAPPEETAPLESVVSAAPLAPVVSEPIAPVVSAEPVVTVEPTPTPTE